MRARRPGWAVYRAAVLVAALYAFVLQGIFGAAVLAAASDPARFDPAHVLCAPKPDGEGPSKPAPTHVHLPCCTAAHLPAQPSPPPTPAELPSPQVGTIVRLSRPEVAAAPRAPPGTRFRARAPPVV